MVVISATGISTTKNKRKIWAASSSGVSGGSYPREDGLRRVRISDSRQEARGREKKQAACNRAESRRGNDQKRFCMWTTWGKSCDRRRAWRRPAGQVPSPAKPKETKAGRMSLQQKVKTPTRAWPRHRHGTGSGNGGGKGARHSKSGERGGGELGGGQGGTPRGRWVRRGGRGGASPCAEGDGRK